MRIKNKTFLYKSNIIIYLQNIKQLKIDFKSLYILYVYIILKIAQTVYFVQCFGKFLPFEKQKNALKRVKINNKRVLLSTHIIIYLKIKIEIQVF